jgi:predicted ATP-grasp superfamily ATP-dependent carboligase
MARTGRPPKPIEVKKAIGTFRPDRVHGSVAVVPTVVLELDELPPASAFEQIVEQARGWLAGSDGAAVALLRESLEERAELRQAVLSGLGDRKQLRELDKQIIGQLSALGFDPTARARLGFTEVKKASALDELLARRNAD